jgi:hypothetical protein
MNEADIHLLYTGGYDSTFRLLESIILEKKIVQPHYIIDHRRRSKHLELKAIKNIFARIEKKFPEARKNILDIIITHLKDIPKSGNDIKIHELRKNMHLGDQYFWLVDYTYLYPTETFELSIEKDEEPGHGISKNLIDNTIGQLAECRLVKKPLLEELNVFRNFRFPILDITKREMLKKAKANNFADILLRAWTCHIPTIFNNPCGRCKPCKLSIETGFTQLFNKAALKRYEKATNTKP